MTTDTAASHFTPARHATILLSPKDADEGFVPATDIVRTIQKLYGFEEGTGVLQITGITDTYQRRPAGTKWPCVWYVNGQVWRSMPTPYSRFYIVEATKVSPRKMRLSVRMSLT